MLPHKSASEEHKGTLARSLMAAFPDQPRVGWVLKAVSFLTVSVCLGNRSQTSSLPSHLLTWHTVPRLPRDSALISLLHEQGVACVKYWVSRAGSYSSTEHQEET